MPWAASAGAPEYSDTQWALMQRTLFGAFSGHRDFGVASTYDQSFQVESHPDEGMKVWVRSGSALVNGRWVGDTNPFYGERRVINILAADPTYPRWDLITLMTDIPGKNALLYYHNGTPGASPAVPPLIQNPLGAFEIPLAQIYVPAGTTNITASNIVDRRLTLGSADRLITSVWVPIGVTIEFGTLVLADPLTATVRPYAEVQRTVKSNTALGNQDIIVGVALKSGVSESWIPVLTRGICMAKCVGEFQANQLVCRSQVTPSIIGNSGISPLGYALSYVPSTAGYGLFYIDTHLANMMPQQAHFVYADGATTTTQQTWTDTAFQASLYSRTGYIEIEVSCMLSSSAANVMDIGIGINGENMLVTGPEPYCRMQGTAANQVLTFTGQRRITVTPGVVTANLWIRQASAGTLTLHRTGSYPRPRITMREVFGPANAQTIG
jgi:hypothetical protein